MPEEEQEDMVGQGQQQMMQEELNRALYEACGRVNDLARAEELLGRGADQHAKPTVTGMPCTRLLTTVESRL
jgi:hypothetical protein